MALVLWLHPSNSMIGRARLYCDNSMAQCGVLGVCRFSYKRSAPSQCILSSSEFRRNLVTTDAYRAWRAYARKMRC